MLGKGGSIQRTGAEHQDAAGIAQHRFENLALGLDDVLVREGEAETVNRLPMVTPVWSAPLEADTIMRRF